MAAVVECTHGPSCSLDRHGWDCPMSDPMGDVLRHMMDPSPNPILEQSRRTMLKQYGVDVEAPIGLRRVCMPCFDRDHDACQGGTCTCTHKDD
jgi:hypothetical protein